MSVIVWSVLLLLDRISLQMVDWKLNLPKSVKDWSSENDYSLLAVCLEKKQSFDVR